MSRRYRLSRKALENLDDRLFNYREIDIKINRRKFELEHDKKPSLNIGGGKSGKISSPVEDIVIKWDEDSQLNSMYAFKSAVNKVIEKLNEEMLEIFMARWLDENEPTWEEIAEKLYISRRTVYRKRQIILELFDKYSGELG